MIVPNEKRLKLVALIATFGLTCYQAAKIQDIPYTNAKVYYEQYISSYTRVEYSKFLLTKQVIAYISKA